MPYLIDFKFIVLRLIYHSIETTILLKCHSLYFSELCQVGPTIQIRNVKFYKNPTYVVATAGLLPTYIQTDIRQTDTIMKL